MKFINLLEEKKEGNCFPYQEIGNEQVRELNLKFFPHLRISVVLYTVFHGFGLLEIEMLIHSLLV